MLLKHARDVWEEDIDPQCSLHSQSQCSYEHNNKCKQGYFSQKRQKDLPLHNIKGYMYVQAVPVHFMTS